MAGSQIKNQSPVMVVAQRKPPGVNPANNSLGPEWGPAPEVEVALKKNSPDTLGRGVVFILFILFNFLKFFNFFAWQIGVKKGARRWPALCDHRHLP